MAWGGDLCEVSVCLLGCTGGRVVGRHSRLSYAMMVPEARRCLALWFGMQTGDPRRLTSRCAASLLVDLTECECLTDNYDTRNDDILLRQQYIANVRYGYTLTR